MIEQEMWNLAPQLRHDMYPPPEHRDMNCGPGAAGAILKRAECFGDLSQGLRVSSFEGVLSQENQELRGRAPGAPWLHPFDQSGRLIQES